MYTSPDNGAERLPPDSLMEKVVTFIGFSRIHNVGEGFRLFTPDVVIFGLSLMFTIAFRRNPNTFTRTGTLFDLMYDISLSNHYLFDRYRDGSFNKTTINHPSLTLYDSSDVYHRGSLPSLATVWLFVILPRRNHAQSS